MPAKARFVSSSTVPLPFSLWSRANLYGYYIPSRKIKLFLGRQNHFPSNFSCKCQRKRSYSTGEDSFLKEPALLKAHVGDHLIWATYSFLQLLVLFRPVAEGRSSNLYSSTESWHSQTHPLPMGKG